MSGWVHLSCPWCSWVEDWVSDEPKDKAVEMARLRVEQHTAEAGHTVKRGRRPRVGYFRGEPVQ